MPFAAEVHRWAHVGAMEIASKATRAATGFYSRGYLTAATESQRQGVPAELQDLCNAVRATREGAVSMPVRTLVALAVLLAVSLAWWAAERIGALLAGLGFAGPAGAVRAFLILRRELWARQAGSQGRCQGRQGLDQVSILLTKTAGRSAGGIRGSARRRGSE